MRGESAAETLVDVMRRVANSDKEAFASFYDATAPMVFGIALRVIRDPAQAEEVSQEVFLEAWRIAKRYDPKQGSPAAWIGTIAHRRAIDRVRLVERASARDLRHAQAEAPNQVPDVSEIVISADEGDRVRRALGGLPEAQRTALSLAYYQGLTQREVAERLGIPLGTVKTRTRDALRALRTTLGRRQPS